MKEKTEAVYAMAKLGNDSDWRGNIGVRAVHTELNTLQYSPNATVANDVIAVLRRRAATVNGQAAAIGISCPAPT